MTFTSASWQPDAIGDPEGIPFGEWWRVGLRLKATCSCGHSQDVHTAELLKRYGEFKYADARLRAAIAPRLKCIRCQRRGPDLSFEVAAQ